LDAQGNIYMAGKTQGTIQWNATISTQTSGFNTDVLILKYSPQGNLLWTKTAGGNSENRSDGISILTDGSVIVTGVANETVSFDALQHTAPAFQFYPFVAKLNTSTLAVATNTKVPTVVYPNPTHTALTLSVPGYRGKAELMTVVGQQVKNFEITNDTTLVDLSALASGTYFLKVNQEVVKVLKN
jgi:hypothetical protein